MKIKKLLTIILLLAIILVPLNEIIEAKEVEDKYAYPDSLVITIKREYKGLYSSEPNRISYAVTRNYRVYTGSLYKTKSRTSNGKKYAIYTGTLYYNPNIKPRNVDLLK